MIRYRALERIYKEKRFHIKGVAPEGYLERWKKLGVSNPNSCATRLGIAIFMLDNKFFEGKQPPTKDKWGNIPQKAVHLAWVQNKKFRIAKKIKNAAEINGANGYPPKKGIIYFEFKYWVEALDIYAGTGHISLWDGSKTVDDGDKYWGRKRQWFWELH